MNTRSATLALSAAALLFACDGKKEGAASTTSPATTAHTKPAPLTPYTTPSTPLSEALAPFADAVELSSIEDAAPPDAPLVWSAPPEGCVLGYESLARGEVRVEGGDDSVKHIDYYSEFGLKRGEGVDIEVAPGKFLIANNAEDADKKQGSPTAVLPAGYAAPTMLSVSGGELAEVRGPTSTWSASGLYSGPVYFFPALPDHTALGHGEERAWTFTWHARGSGQKVEAERGMTRIPRALSFMDPRPISKSATSKIERWLDLSGQRVALVSTRMDLAEAPEPAFMPDGKRVLAQAQGEVIGHYLISAQGHLIAARVISNRDARMRGLDDPDKNTRRVAKFDATARLVSGCKGASAPVAKSLGRKESVEEQALMVWSKLRNTIVLERIEEPLEPLFTSELWEAHGDRIATALEEQVERQDVNAIGHLMMFRHITLIARDGDTIVLSLPGETRATREDGERVVTTFEVEVTFEVIEEQPKIAKILITDPALEASRNIVLEISPARIFGLEP
jgi:hypothetical protein